MIARRRSALATGVLAVALIASVGRPCAADDPPAARRPALSETLVGESKADYDAAKLLFEDGDFAGAASKFRQAYDRAKEPRLLWNIAVCEKGLRHYARVQTLVQRYLDDGRDIISPEQTRAARDLREAVKAFIGTLNVTAAPGTELSIDGEPVGRTPFERPMPLDLGPHKLTAEKAGFRPFTTSFEIAGGAETKLEVALVALSSKARLAVQAGEGDTIAFDGTVMAATRWQAEVESGTHSLRVTAPRRKPYELRLDLVAGSNRTVEVTLENERLLWPWIVGGIALVGGAVVGGYFLFKSDQKPADQPNGSLAPGFVQLSRWAP
jgi:PEGA domain